MSMGRLTRGQKRRIAKRKRRIIAREKKVREVLTGKRPALVPVVKQRKRVIIKTVPTKAEVGDLGPAQELGPDVILRVEFAPSAASLIRNQAHRLPRALQVNSLRKLIKRHVYLPLVSFTEPRIEAWTPIDKTDLMESEKAAMRSPYSVPPDKLTTNVDMVIHLGTPGINYASIVAKMPRAWIIHPLPTHRNASKRGGVLHSLYDPKAKENFYQFILIGARNKAKSLARKFVRGPLTAIFAKYPNLFPQPLTAAQQLFNWYNPFMIRV